ncbi:DUF2935 domain-containing protein [Senegalia sp. (in: firmicutes)]|uniref:DUF2935 domain-containing protein n=1 Tax=Senegalia sp. (in: firmicutes) TaxID=1924098 RepID=UPI003F9BCAAF
MKYFYGDKNPLRVLDEIELWKHQESEHTVVIRQIVKDLEDDFVEELKAWELALSQAEAMAVRYIEAINRSTNQIDYELLEEIKDFIEFSINQSLSFVEYLNILVAESKAVSNNEIAVVVINHIRRESEYLIGIIKAALKYF